MQGRAKRNAVAMDQGQAGLHGAGVVVDLLCRLLIDKKNILIGGNS
jgi:hypothetical protein